MRRLVLAAMILPSLVGCATHRQSAEARSVDAVVQDEGQRQKVLSAIHAGATPAEAMAKVSDGPKTSEPTLPQPGPK